MMVVFDKKQNNIIKMQMRQLKKRGVSVWVSWVLLLAFMVILSAFMYNWIYGYTEESTEEMKKRVENTETCESLAMTVDNVCQDSQILYINITNRGNINLNQIIFRLYDFEEMVTTSKKNITVRPNAEEEVRVLKSIVVNELDAIPVVITTDQIIICRNKMHTIVNIEDC